MTEKSMPAANLIGHRSLRCLLVALFAAAFGAAFALLFDVVTADRAPYLSLLILAIGFAAAQLHERLVRQAG